MTRLRAKAWSMRAAMFHVPLEALHQTLEAYLSGLNVSVAGHLSFFYWPHKVSLHLTIKEKAMKVCEYKIRPRHA